MWWLIKQHQQPTTHKQVVVATRDQPIMLIFIPILCYAAVLVKFTYYAQNYAQE